MLYTMNMKRILTLLGIIAVGSLSLFSISLLSTGHPEPVAGATNTTNLIGGFPYFLAGSGISSSATSITVTSFTLPQTGYKILTADLSNPFYMTLEAGSTSRQEFVSCTAVVQNANNTATFTGCVRGLLPISPYTTNGSYAFSHSGGTTLIFSNSPAFYSGFYALGNVSTSTNTLIFSSTTPPRYDFTAAQGTGTYISTTSELASIDYVNKVALVSAPNATTGIKGVSQLATALQQASSTALGSTGASLILTSSNATDTPQRGCAVGFTGIAGAGCNLIADLTGHVKQAWIDLTAAFTVSGAWTFNGSATFNGSTSFPGGTVAFATTTSSTNAIGKKFGGTGADGTLSCSSGVTTINLGSVTFFEKNYSSISITGTCQVNFSNPATSGTIVILKSQGNTTVTSATVPALDLRALGSLQGSGGTGTPSGTGGGGSGGASMLAAGTVGVSGGNIGVTGPPTAGTTFGKWIYSLTGTSETGGGVSPTCNSSAPGLSTSPALPTTNSIPNVLRFYVMPGTGGGGACPGTSGNGGDGGRGGGALYMEVGGNLNITSTIDSSGSTSPSTATASQGCGGGGGGGVIEIIYNYLTANSGTYTVSGGVSGSTCNDAGGVGGVGFSSVTQNTDF